MTITAGAHAPHSRRPRPRRFGPRSLPCERIRALAEEATTSLGVDTPQTWQLT
ncbi:hypothetical protein [Streptomyces sp. NPDC060002]|uniref:hypothetical protein n=1 Tax=Streptomyces sp. NPDC060002 TaxID=3347033 RepID=UPI0036C9E5D7